MIYYRLVICHLSQATCFGLIVSIHEGKSSSIPLPYVLWIKFRGGTNRHFIHVGLFQGLEFFICHGRCILMEKSFTTQGLFTLESLDCKPITQVVFCLKDETIVRAVSSTKQRNYKWVVVQSIGITLITRAMAHRTKSMTMM